MKKIYLFFIFLFFVYSVNSAITIYNSSGTGNMDKYCNSGTCFNNTDLGIAGNGIESSRFQSFIYFNLSNIENTNVTIIRAFLNLTIDNNGQNITIPVHRINISWDGANNTQPTKETNFTSFVSSSSTGGSGIGFNDTINITTIIQGFANSSYPNYGFMLNGSIGGSSITWYSSFDYSNINYRPLLYVQYTSIPTINLSTPLNNTNSSNSTNYFVCNSTDSIGLKNITLSIYNQGGSINSTNSTIITGKSNSTNISLNLLDGNFTWNCQVFNTEGNNISGVNRTITIDTTPPTINIVTPQNATYNTTTMAFNYSVIDNGIGLSTCWWKNDTGNNITVPCNQNISFPQSAGYHYLYFWANDTLGNTAQVIRYYLIDTTNPIVNLVSPSNNQWLNNGTNILFNITAQDPFSNGIKNCSLYGNWTGSFIRNQSNTTNMPGGSLINYNFKLNITDGFYNWNTYCWESTGTKFAWNLVNNSFGIDTIFPSINITQLLTVVGSQTITFNFSTNDTNSLSCKFKITNSLGGIDGPYNNLSTPCNTQAQATVSSFDSFNLTIYSIDPAGNENSSTQSFTTSNIAPVIVQGGGGGEITNQISVVAIYNNNYTNLTNAIIYARIRENCKNLTSCKLNISLLQVLSEENVLLTQKELQMMFDSYNNDELQSVYLSQEDIINYNLFTGVIQIGETPFRLNPSTLDPFFTFSLFSNKFKFEIKSNKIIKNVSINGELGLSINQTSDNTADVILDIYNLDYSTKIFTGTATFTDINGNVVYLPITIRNFNLKSPTVIFGILVFLSLCGFLLYKNYKK